MISTLEYQLKDIIMDFNNDFKPNNATKWNQTGKCVAGKTEFGNDLAHLHEPCGIYINTLNNIYIADFMNHRIVKWIHDEQTGKVVAGNGHPGNELNQLNQPTSVYVDEKRKRIIICDSKNQRVMAWPLNDGKSGKLLIPKIQCTCVTMDQYGYLYISEDKDHSVVRWHDEDLSVPIRVAGNGTPGSDNSQLDCPSYLFVDKDQTVYVSDVKNKRVMKWIKNAKQGIVITLDNELKKSFPEFKPAGLSVSSDGSVYVVDCAGHRVIRWKKDATQGTVIAGGHR